MTRRAVAMLWLWAATACFTEPEAVDGGPCFVVEPRTDFDFGEVESGPFSVFATSHFTVVNPTDSLRLIVASPPPAPFSIAPGSSRLLSGARETWSVSFAPSDALLHLGEIVLRDDQGCEVPLSVRGLGAGTLSAPPALDFGFVAPGDERTLDVLLVNTERRPVAILGLDLVSQSNVFRLEGAQPTVVPASGTAVVRVRAAPVAPALSSAALVVNATHGQTRTTLRVVSGRPSAVVEPRGLSARAAPSVFVERTVRVTNTAPSGGDGTEVLFLQTPFVSARAFDGGAVAGFSLRPQASLTGGLRGGESGELIVRFDTPPVPGPAGGMISVFTTDPLQAAIDVAFEVDVTPLETCTLAVTPRPLELTALGDGGSAGTLRFDVVDGGACLVDDVRLINGSAPGLRVLDDAGVQRTAPFELTVVAPTPTTRSRVGAVQFHVLQVGEVVRYADVYASP